MGHLPVYFKGYGILIAPLSKPHHLLGKHVSLALAPLCMMFSCVFLIFPHGVSGQVWYLIVSIPDLCFLLY